MSELLPFRVDPLLVLLTVDDFLLLRKSGAFAAYSKAELIEGELWGVPRRPDDEPESDAIHPIKITVDQYEMLDRSGAFEGRTELIEGSIFKMSPQFRPHGFLKDELAYRLRRALEALDSNLGVATEQSVDFAPHSEPQPDIILTPERHGAGPIPSTSVALILEVSGSTIRFDLGTKADLYAAENIPEYWVADVERRVVHLMWAPLRGSYVQRAKVKLGQALRSATIEGLEVDTSGL